MAVYRVKLFTPKTNQYHYGDREYCLKNNLLSVGWVVKKNENIEDYEKRYLNQYEKEKIKAQKESKKIPRNSFKTCFIKNMKNIKNDDFVWVKTDGTTYYLGQIKSDLKKDENNLRIGFVRDCNWLKIKIENIPEQVRRRFIGSGYTLVKMNVDEDFEILCKKLYENAKDKG